MTDISIVLCTYNGKNYIKEQLNSIYNQTLLPNEIIICDDRSTDNTIEIIKNWIIDKKTSIDIKIIVNEEQLGPIKNFEKGLLLSRGSYIFFCDQDDIWLPCKIEKTYTKMKEMETLYGDIPLLVHTDLMVVDKHLRLINYSMFQSQGLKNAEKYPLKTLLVQNYITGCTMMINKIAKQESLPFPNKIIMHDWWMGLIVAATGKIGFINEPTIKYRQHGHNTIGAKKYLSITNIKKLFQLNKILKGINNIINQDIAFKEYKCGILKKKDPIIINDIQALSSQNLFYLYNNKIFKQGVLRNIFFYFFLFIYKLKK